MIRIGGWIKGVAAALLLAGTPRGSQALVADEVGFALDWIAA